MEEQLFYYIKDGRILAFANELDPELFRIGETYSDYQSGKFVPLNEEQIDYYLNHKGAAIDIIWNFGVFERKLEDVRDQKLQSLADYDKSSAVNNFTINGVLNAWFTPEERSNYSNSIQAAKLLNMDTLMFAVGTHVLQVPTSSAEVMLASIQLYADACYMVTKQHELTISSLQSIEEIDEYDFTTGYPQQLNFDLQ